MFFLIFDALVLLNQILICFVSVCAVLAGNEANDLAAGARAEAWRLGSDRLRLLPPGALEAGGGRSQPAALHLGGHLPHAALPPGAGSPFLPLSNVHRVRRQGTPSRFAKHLHDLELK